MTDPEAAPHLSDPRRKGRITASMVGAILGNNPWMTRDDAMRTMVREALGADREFTGNIATEWGNSNEDGAILEFQMETGIGVEKAPFCIMEDWAGATPDSWTSDGGLLETKCPFGLRNEPSPVSFKTLADQVHYADQVQFQLWVTGKPYAHFFQWTPNGTKHETVMASQSWRDKNQPKLRQFHAQYLSELENPEEHLAPKRVIIDTPEAAKMMREWDELSEAIERATERKKDLMADIAALGKGKNALVAGRKVTLVEKAGAISYAKAIKELLPNADLEKWRGKASSFWKVS